KPVHRKLFLLRRPRRRFDFLGRVPIPSPIRGSPAARAHPDPGHSLERDRFRAHGPRIETARGNPNRSGACFMNEPRRLFLSALIVLSIIPSATRAQSQAAPQAEATSTSPKLVVIVVIDQMRGDYIERYSRFLARDGFARLTRQGAYFVNA